MERGNPLATLTPRTSFVPQPRCGSNEVAQVTCEQPFKGIGKPEPLKYIDVDIWSQCINLEHRLVYRISGDRIYFLQCRYHDDKA